MIAVTETEIGETGTTLVVGTRNVIEMLMRESGRTVVKMSQPL